MGQYLIIYLPHPGRYYLLREQSNTIKILDLRNLRDDSRLERWIDNEAKINLESNLISENEVDEEEVAIIDIEEED